jgi:hypothetical protein
MMCNSNMTLKHYRISLTTLVLIFAATLPAYSERHSSRLVTQPIDETRVVRLQGSVHPLTKAGNDRGAVPDAMPAGRIVLLLSRPAEQEMALQQFLKDIHNRRSANYHKWITPEQFGEQFGPTDTDIQTAVSWLQSHGFNVAKTSKSRQFIEFSGTAGQLRDALHTEIHRYDVEGETHYANAEEISIPSALTSLVRAVSPLNNFRAKPYVKVAGSAAYSHIAHKATPLWTVQNPFGTSNPNAFLLAPGDFATQYDVTPLYQAGVNGSGETIGIINESNIDISLVNNYRELFGLPVNPTQLVIDGGDPGTLGGIDVEAYLDVELSGAIAPNATVNLYISSGGDLQDPLALAAIRAVEDNQASVLSVSFGQCEGSLENGGNQFWSELWQQAAAQGQTVLVASGDTGPYCNGVFFKSVSGFASTPWNVAVGGTDFFYSDYATGGASAATLWDQTNDSKLGSLKGPLPEQVWNDPFGLDIISNGLQRGEIAAGGSGVSSCSTLSSSGCIRGYAKPSWQTGPGVPTDGVRDLPDVSLFASNGANLSAYPICAFAGECITNANGVSEVLLIGGTSASAPAMAGIMALVDQKFGRQGQANFTLYPLAQQKPAAFHDITVGSNDSPCQSGSIDCALNANGSFATTVYSAGPGFDLASGLGSVDANLLVNNWNTITLLPTTTAFSLSSSNIKHGTPVTVTTSVAPTSGSGTPSGAVAIFTSSTLPAGQAQTVFTLNGSKATSSIDSFPGGSYNLTASYSGDGVFRASTSPPVALNVTPENSNINFSVLNGQTAFGSGGSIQYNSPLSLNVQPSGVSAPSGKTNGNATGSATFTVDSTTAIVALDAAGIASWIPPALAPGNHASGATYSGDASFNASAANPVHFTVTQGTPVINDNINAPRSQGVPGFDVPPGGSLTIGITVSPSNSGILGTVAPTGTVTACLGAPGNVAVPCANPTFSQTGALREGSGEHAQSSSTVVTFSNLTAGTYTPSYSYSGDSNWKPFGLVDLAFVNVVNPSSQPIPTTILSINSPAISGTELATLTTTVTGMGAIPPTGQVDLYDNNVFLAFFVLPPVKSGATSSASIGLIPSSFQANGVNEISAVYDGDGNYSPSLSNTADISVSQSGDFSLAPQLPQITIRPGGSGTVGLNLASFRNFNGNVTFTCTPSSSQISCNVNPSSLALNGTATAMLTVNASAQVMVMPGRRPGRRFEWLDATAGLFFASVFLTGFKVRSGRLSTLLFFCVLAILLALSACGTGQNNQPPPPPPPPPANAQMYSIVVSATTNGLIHDSKVLVVVR